MNLTKQNIIDQVALNADLPKAKAINVVEVALELMKSTLANDEDVLISGFGKFEVKKKHARKGHNPQTRQTIELEARTVVTFHSSLILKELVNGDGRGGGQQEG